MDTTCMNIIDAHNICKIYGKGKNEVRALDNICFSAVRGELVAVVGESGSGKSTLMNILGCLDKPDSGRYLLEGDDVSLMPQRSISEIRRRRIGFVFQKFNLIPSLTALENVELPMAYMKYKQSRRKQQAVAALEAVGLGNRLNHRPNELSGGQQQRVAIARAVAHRPAVILADEPTGNLDSDAGERIIRLLTEINRDGTTVIIITHNEKTAAAAERRVRICDGKTL